MRSRHDGFFHFDDTSLVLGGKGADVEEFVLILQRGFHAHFVSAFSNLLSFRVSEIPNESLLATLLGRCSGESIQLGVSHISRLSIGYPCGHTGRTIGIATLDGLTFAHTAFGCKRGDEEGLHHFVLLIFNPHGILVRAMALFLNGGSTN